MSEPVDEPSAERVGEASGVPVEGMGRRLDETWADFRRLVAAFPAERFGERLAEASWTRKQMLAHVCAWHDSASDRLARFLVTGEPVPLADEVEAFNARVARSAEGRTAGEIVRWLDDSHGRLRRLAGRLSAAQLAANDGWAARVIAENSYEHYAEHRPDLELPPAGQARL